MISNDYRFHGHGSLRYVYKNGKAIRSHLVTIKYVDNPHRKNSRFAVVVSKKVLKSAVGRNRIRRRVYEIVRKELGSIDKAHDVALMVFSSELLSLSANDLNQLIRQLFEQGDLYK